MDQLYFTPLPTPGSSGGPIVDEENGAVVGVMLGTRMDNRIEGVRGWGVPSEAIFEVNHFVDFLFPSVFLRLIQDVLSTGSGRQEINYLMVFLYVGKNASRFSGV